MKYRVTQVYRATTGDQHYAFTAGSEVELADDVAAWVNRDCPGLLVEIKPPRKRAAKKRQTRQVVAADNREEV